MSTQITDPTGLTKDIVAVSIVANSLRCGACFCPVIEGQMFFTLDAPYHCLVHDRCLTFFEYNKKGRMAATSTETRMLQESDFDERDKFVQKYMGNPALQKKIPTKIREHFCRILAQIKLINAWRREFLGDETDKLIVEETKKIEEETEKEAKKINYD